jgi:Rel/ankyrin family protein
MVLASCVTKDSPYRAHPHNLVGKDGCKRGICTVEVNGENMIATFANLGIQCVKKRDIEEALKLREDIRVDPFRGIKYFLLKKKKSFSSNISNIFYITLILYF